MRESGVGKAIERAARESFGRLVALLAARSGDVVGAEDALADAFAAALRTWPLGGVPRNPEGWLLTAARRRQLDRYRRGRVAHLSSEALTIALEEAQTMAEAQAIPDERLKLMFACAHPAIDPGIRTPLMLQTVLGLDAARIASAFLTAPEAMSKRLSRAKTRIREMRIPFIIPDLSDMPARRGDVLAAIYAAFTMGSDQPDLAVRGEMLAEEAIWLGRLVVALLPGDPEAEGLLALMLFSHARKDARRAADGLYVPLAAQPVEAWDEPLLAEAEALLSQAGRRRDPGRYQYEAAIQAVHVDRRHSDRTDWSTIAQLYGRLVEITDSLGAKVARAAALCEAGEPAHALAVLEEIDPDIVAAYQPYWATLGHVLTALDRAADAAMALTRAAGLTEDAAVRAHLLAKRETLAH